MILAAIFILFLISFVITGLNLSRLRPGYLWFLAIGGALTAWLLLLFSYTSVPHTISIVNWQSGGLFPSSPALLSDDYSWPFAMAITTLLLGVLLTDVARVGEIDPTAWATSLAMTASGLLAVLAANPLTLLMGWAIIDLAETMTLLRQVSGSDQRERVVVSFSVRVTGMLMVLSAMLRTQVLGVNLSFRDIPPEVSGYLILATGLRLGVLPPHQPFLQEPPLRRGLGTIVRLIPVAASLVLLTRVAEVGAPSGWELPVLVVSALAALYGGFSWIRSRNELDGRPFWILGLAALSVATTVRSQPMASQAWGLGLLFSGGLLFLSSTRHRRLLWLLILGLIGFSALPFTPTWRGSSLFAGWNLIYGGVFSLSLALLILGYFRYAIRENETQDEIERWVWAVYPLGLVILPLTHFGMAWALGGFSSPEGGVMFIQWRWGALTLGLAALLWVLTRRGVEISPRLMTTFRQAFSLNWLYRLFWWTYRSMSKLISYFALVLEGEGGVLWAVLIMILLVTVIVQYSGGG